MAGTTLPQSESTFPMSLTDVLDRLGCDRDKARRAEWPGAKVLIKSLPQGLQKNAWQDLILVQPLSTATVERGFSAMKWTKTDLRSNLSVHLGGSRLGAL